VLRPDKSARTCLSPAESGASFRALRTLRRRAGNSGTRASSFGSFSWTRKKMNNHFEEKIAISLYSLRVYARIREFRLKLKADQKRGDEIWRRSWVFNPDSTFAGI
jgi:hypothetical protein